MSWEFGGWGMPLSVYLFIIFTALGIATACLGLLAFLRWAWKWASFCWKEREVLVYYWNLQFKRSKGKH